MKKKILNSLMLVLITSLSMGQNLGKIVYFGPGGGFGTEGLGGAQILSQTLSTTGKGGFSFYMQTGTNTPMLSMLINDIGNVGIGTASPFEKLEVNGGIKLGNSNGTNPGTLRYNSTAGKFEGINGSGNWVPFVQAPTDLWDANGDDIYNTNPNNVGIGTTTPQQKLHLFSQDNSICGTGLRLEYRFTGIPDGCLGNSTWDIIANGGERLNFFNSPSLYPVLTLTGTGKTIISNASDCNISNLSLIVNGHILLTDGPTQEPRTIYWGYNCAPEWGLEYDAPGNPLNTNGGLNFWNPYTSSSGLKNGILFLENGTGNVGIGTMNLNTDGGIYKLTVNGKILCEELKVIQDVPDADYVFEKNYELLSLSQLENYIKENKHLPEIPSAEDFKKNGYKVGEMDNMLLQKIEELTLYLIELKKENEQQQKQILELQNKIKK